MMDSLLSWLQSNLLVLVLIAAIILGALAWISFQTDEEEGNLSSRMDKEIALIRARQRRMR